VAGGQAYSKGRLFGGECPPEQKKKKKTGGDDPPKKRTTTAQFDNGALRKAYVFDKMGGNIRAEECSVEKKPQEAEGGTNMREEYSPSEKVG